MLRNVKAGDWIFTIQHGWDRVRKLEGGRSGDQVRTNTGIAYHLNGNLVLHDKHPSAWVYNPFDHNDAPPFEPIKGQVVAMRDDPNDCWRYGQYNGERNRCGSKPGKEYVITIWKENVNYNHIRELTKEEKGEQSC